MASESASNTSKPTVSVVIPTYNRGTKLNRAANSVCDQTYKKWKLYVVNDDPENDVREFLPEDDRINYIQHKQNKGAPAARNTGIRASEAPYIAFLDDDDAWKPEKLERQVNAFQKLSQDHGLVHTGGDVVRDDTIVRTHKPTINGEVFNELLAGNLILSATPIIRRECIKHVGYFDTELESSQDFDLWLRIARSYKISAIPDSLAIVYKEHEDRISRDQRRLYNGKKRILDKYRQTLEKNPSAMSKHLKQLGAHALMINRPAEARRYLMYSLIYDMFRISAFYYILATFFPNKIQHAMLHYATDLA